MHVKELIDNIQAGVISTAQIDAPEVYKILPVGWHDLAKMCIRLTDLFDNCIVKVGISGGLLVVNFKGNNQLDDQICDLFRNAIAKKSSVTCMVCGKWGFRRKAEALMPTLCGPHYVEFINHIDELEHNGLQV